MITQILKQCKYISFIVLLPYTVYYSPEDSSYTDVSFGAGGGHYAYQDCSGIHERSYADAGVTISSKMSGPFRIGGSLGGIVTYGNDVGGGPIIYPELALDFKDFAIGTTGLRYGDFNETYLQLGLVNSSPPFSGRGFLNLGVGWNAGTPFSRMWFGVNGIPYGRIGLVLQPEFPLSNNKFLFITTRYGTYLDRSEWGLSVGMRFRTLQ